MAKKNEFVYYINSNSQKIELTYKNLELSNNWTLERIIFNKKCVKDLVILNKSPKNLRFSINLLDTCESDMSFVFKNGNTEIFIRGFFIFSKTSEKFSKESKITTFQIDQVFYQNNISYKAIGVELDSKNYRINNNLLSFTREFGDVFYCYERKPKISLDYLKSCKKNTNRENDSFSSLVFVFDKNATILKFIQFKFNFQIGENTFPFGTGQITLYVK